MTQLQKFSETFGGTDQRWLLSREGTDTAETVTLDHDSWDQLVVNGRLKGGEPMKAGSGGTAGKMIPYGGTGSLAGFLLNDVPFRVGGGDKVAPMLNRGRIAVKYLPSTVAVGATLAAGARFKLVDVTV
jgi:hypothetical protein